jgi:hypothetical protein
MSEEAAIIRRDSVGKPSDERRDSLSKLRSSVGFIYLLINKTYFLFL